MSTAAFPIDLSSIRIQALLDRLDPAAETACTIPGCQHLHADHDERPARAA
jgi:hypothetical protein